MQYPSYNPASDNLPLSDEELGQLDDLLAELPADGAMNIEALDGYLTALLLCPVPVASLPGEAWIPQVWGGDGEGQAPFASGKQRKKATLMVLRHLNSLAHTLSREPQAWEPIFSQAEENGQELVDAEDWCTGFMIGVDLGGDAWAARFENDATAALLAPIALLGGAEAQQSPDDLARLHDLHQLDALSREVPEAVLGLCRQQA